MVTKLCLLVPLASGEDVRQVLVEQGCLDRAFTPRRIGDELALPVHEGFLPNARVSSTDLNKWRWKYHHPP